MSAQNPVSKESDLSLNLDDIFNSDFWQEEMSNMEDIMDQVVNSTTTPGIHLAHLRQRTAGKSTRKKNKIILEDLLDRSANGEEINIPHEVLVKAKKWIDKIRARERVQAASMGASFSHDIASTTEINPTYDRSPVQLTTAHQDITTSSNSAEVTPGISAIPPATACLGTGNSNANVSKPLSYNQIIPASFTAPMNLPFNPSEVILHPITNVNSDTTKQQLGILIPVQRVSTEIPTFVAQPVQLRTACSISNNQSRSRT